jgi:hypothetical protein
VREFATLEGFIKHLATLPAAVERATPTGLEAAAALIEKTAKDEIGHYQEADGPFNAWLPLSGATLEGFYAEGIGYVPGKEELGYAPPDNPLLRDGDLRESYGHQVAGYEASIGSPSLIALWQELGTPDARFPIPPRSVLGVAAYRCEHVVVDMMMSPCVRALAGLPPRNRPQAEEDFR